MLDQFNLMLFNKIYEHFKIATLTTIFVTDGASWHPSNKIYNNKLTDLECKKSHILVLKISRH